MNCKSLRLTLLAFGAGALLAGCAPKLTWTPTQPSPKPFVKRAVSSVEVFTQPPQRGFVEVGVIAGEKRRSSSTDARAKLTEAIHKKAAKLGCDAIFVRDQSQPEIPGSKKQPPIALEAGCLMWTEDAAPMAAAPTTAAPGSASTAAPSGCANDMQCKGNRICENGQCVSPPAPTTGPSDAGTADAASGQKCDMDTDCPGDEVCQDHVCQNPS